MKKRIVPITLFALTVLMMAIGFTLANTLAAPTDAGTAAGALAADSDPINQVSTIVTAFKKHEYKTAIAAVLTFGLFFWRRFGQSFLIGKVSSTNMAWVTALAGLLTAVPAHLLAGNFSVGRFVLDGFLIGAEAALFWSTLGKRVLPKVFGELPG